VTIGVFCGHEKETYLHTQNMKTHTRGVLTHNLRIILGPLSHLPTANSHTGTQTHPTIHPCTRTLTTSTSSVGPPSPFTHAIKCKRVSFSEGAGWALYKTPQTHTPFYSHLHPHEHQNTQPRDHPWAHPGPRRQPTHAT